MPLLRRHAADGRGGVPPLLARGRSAAGPLLGAAAAFRPAVFGPHLAGLLLTLAGTAAGLVPPYLTMPLTDDVLIPLQRQHADGVDVDLSDVLWQVAPYLAGFLGAIIVSWALSWARTYVLAWVSERIARRPAQPHLRAPAAAVAGVLRRQAHRRPDVAHRQRHRPHLQLPVAATCVDFATDVLMIAMTAVDPAVDQPAAGRWSRCCRFPSSPG